MTDTKHNKLGRKVEADDTDGLVVPFAICLNLATSAKIGDLPILEAVLAKAIDDLRSRFEKDGFKVYVGSGSVHPMSQEQLLLYIPRKVHLTDGLSGWKCTTPHVSLKNVTNDLSKVTCKLCLRP